MRSYRDHRVATQPTGARNAGCIFKNPAGDHAGRLIDSCGLKGLAVGSAVVSDVHANFIINRGGATFADLARLIDSIRDAALLRRGQSGRLRRSRRKKRTRRTLFVVLGLWCVGVVLGALYAGRHYVTHASRFALRDIAITPTMHAPREELQRAVNRHIGRNLFRLDLGAIESDLEKVRWVRRAVAKRLVPGPPSTSTGRRR